MQGVDVEEHLGEPLPLEARFTDETGREVRLGDVLPKDKPTLLTLVYYECPMLCNLVINGQVQHDARARAGAGQGLRGHHGEHRPQGHARPEPRAQRRRHLQAMGKPETAAWHFLTGTEDNIHKLTEAVGFKYRYDEASKQYAHPAVVHVITPEASISRYLYGTTFPAKDMKLALVEAASGRVGTSFDRVVLSCFKYDPASRRYSFYVFGFIRTGALLVFTALSTMLIYFWRRELKKGAAS